MDRHSLRRTARELELEPRPRKQKELGEGVRVRAWALAEDPLGKLLEWQEEEDRARHEAGIRSRRRVEEGEDRLKLELWYAAVQGEEEKWENEEEQDSRSVLKAVEDNREEEEDSEDDRERGQDDHSSRKT